MDEETALAIVSVVLCLALVIFFFAAWLML
jgi:hypothetical protein